jgi:hypothetical protein
MANIEITYNTGMMEIGDRLGGGKMNPPSKATATKTTGKRPGLRQVVWKADPGHYRLEGGGVAGMAGEEGISISPFRPTLSSRAVASSKLDRALTNVLARTRFGYVGGRFGVVQDHIEGRLLNDYKADTLARLALFHIPTIVRDLYHLQLIDYITGQADRHDGNVFVTPTSEVRGIDHDLSFGPKDFDAVLKKVGGTAAFHNRGVPKYVSSEVADKVMKLTEGEVDTRIGNLLSAEEVEQAVIRLKKVQRLIGSGAITPVTNWAEVGEYRGYKAIDSTAASTPRPSQVVSAADYVTSAPPQLTVPGGSNQSSSSQRPSSVPKSPYY